jgi:hypothetical protein
MFVISPVTLGMTAEFSGLKSGVTTPRDGKAEANKLNNAQTKKAA